MTRKTALLWFEQYAGGRWEESGDQEVVQLPWGHPHETVGEHLERRVAQAVKEQHVAVGEMDNAFRVRVWLGAFTEINALCKPPERWPDAMVVWRKPDYTLWDAAVTATARLYRYHLDEPGNPIVRSRYDGGFRVLESMASALLKVPGGSKLYQDPGDAIGIAAALLPEHR